MTGQSRSGFIDAYHQVMRMTPGQLRGALTGAAEGIEHQWTRTLVQCSLQLPVGHPVVPRHRSKVAGLQVLAYLGGESRMQVALIAGNPA